MALTFSELTPRRFLPPLARSSRTHSPRGWPGRSAGSDGRRNSESIFSNEAGCRISGHRPLAAKTDEPVSEGIVALLEPFIDTVLVCTMTGLVIIIAGGTDLNPELTTKVGDTIMIDGEAKVAEADDIAGLPREMVESGI